MTGRGLSDSRGLRRVSRLLDRQDIPGLIRCLGDKDEDIQEAAAEALRSVGKPAVEPLLAALPSVGSPGENALAMIGDAAVGPVVARLRAGETQLANTLGLLACVNASGAFHELCSLALRSRHRGARNLGRRYLDRILGGAEGVLFGDNLESLEWVMRQPILQEVTPESLGSLTMSLFSNAFGREIRCALAAGIDQDTESLPEEDRPAVFRWFEAMSVLKGFCEGLDSFSQSFGFTAQDAANKVGGQGIIEHAEQRWPLCSWMDHLLAELQMSPTRRILNPHWRVCASEFMVQLLRAKTKGRRSEADSAV